VLEGKTVHIPDVLNDPEYSFMEGQSVGGYRTALGVPLVREGIAIGVLVLARAAPRRSPLSRSSWSKPSPTRR
jgi:two-component system, NtrC family, sensor kinase